MARLRTVAYLDADGKLLTVKVTPAVAKALETTKKRIYRQDQFWARKCTPFTDVGLTAELIDHTSRPLTYADDASRWEGPRQRVTLFVGLTLPWPVPRLPDGRCGSCFGADLPRYAYCLDCDHSGLELEIPAVEPSRRPRPPADDDLGGGKGPAQPKARFPEGASGKGRAKRKRA